MENILKNLDLTGVNLNKKRDYIRRFQFEKLLKKVNSLEAEILTLKEKVETLEAKDNKGAENAKTSTKRKANTK